MLSYDLVIIGGGEAGLLSSIAAKEAGVEKILLLERGDALGGKLNYILETGFGFKCFKEDLIGPEYSQRLVSKIEELGIDYKINTFVFEIKDNKIISIVNDVDGVQEVETKALIISTGFREIPRGANNIPSSQYAGVYASEVAMSFANQGYRTGKDMVISGANDNGLVLAKRMILEGIHVKLVVDAKPFITATDLNYHNSIKTFEIPLKLGYSIITIHGSERVEGITIAKVDKNNRHIEGSEEYIECDTLILAVDRKPEIDLLRKANITICGFTGGAQVNQFNNTSMDWVFAVGNVVYVHDWLDDIYDECFRTGINVAQFIRGKEKSLSSFEVKAGEGIKFLTPQIIEVEDNDVNIVVKVDREYYNKKIMVKCGNNKILEIENNLIPAGEKQIIKLPKDFINNNTELKEVNVQVVESYYL